jgi:hypothetical protein
MIDYPSAWLVAATIVAAGLAVFARGLGARTAGRHRAPAVTVPLAELMPDWPTPGVVRTGFGWCDLCTRTMPGVVTRDGFRCDCGTPAGGER